LDDNDGLNPTAPRLSGEPLRSARFRAEVLAALEPARGTYIYEACLRDLDEKTSPEDPCGYRAWLSGVVDHCVKRREARTVRILDLGCGNGEFTVMLRLLGYDATGLDVNDRSLRLARLLASENGLPPESFVKGVAGRLPFDDKSFDLVTMISSLEHIEDATLAWLVPELARVCNGAVFVQVPSSMKVSDDHTGLRFVPWMPAPMASLYIALRGPRYRYLVSESARWDVVYRDLEQIERAFSSRFTMALAPRENSYPPCSPERAVLDVRKVLKLGRSSLTLRLPIPWRRLKRAAGTRIEHFYPYYNLVFARK
jgi:ubiquinone/menaquinone biosynthesis C-methylase UbiE